MFNRCLRSGKDRIVAKALQGSIEPGWMAIELLCAKRKHRRARKLCGAVSDRWLELWLSWCNGAGEGGWGQVRAPIMSQN